MRDAIIFDMDGTLFQTDTILEKALEDTFQLLRDSGEWEEETPIHVYRRIMGVPLPVVWETLLPNHAPIIRQKVYDYFLERLIEHINLGNGALYPGVEALFERLNAMQHPLYIASNGLTPYLSAIVSHYRLNRWVSETFSIQQIPTLDKRDLVASIIKKYEITRGYVVGDRLSDIEAAKANGLEAIGCRFDFSREEELRQADYIVNHLCEVEEIVSKRNIRL